MYFLMKLLLGGSSEIYFLDKYFVCTMSSMWLLMYLNTLEQNILTIYNTINGSYIDKHYSNKIRKSITRIGTRNIHIKQKETKMPE